MRHSAISRSALVIAAGLLGSALVRADEPLPAVGPVRAVPTVVAPPIAPGTQPAVAPATAPSVSPATAPAAPVVVDTTAIDGYLAQLTDPDWKKREKALGELIRMGEEAVPALESVNRTTVVDEVRTAVRNALKTIGENRLAGPSYVTLHLKDAPAKSAFDSLSRQAFAKLKPFPENLWEQPGIGNVTIDMDRQPFWVVMRELSRQTNLELTAMNGKLHLTQGNVPPARRAFVSGAFVVVANQINRTQTVDLEQEDPPVDDQFGIQFTAFAEPKLAVIRAASALKIEEALDDKGNSLMVAAGAAGAETDDFNGPVFESETGYSLFASLKYPAKKAGTKIAKLEATATFTLQVESQTIEINNIKTLKEASRLVNGVHITFNDFTKNGDAYQLRMTIASDPANAAAFQQIQGTIEGRLRVVDAAGQALDHRGFGSNGQENRIELTINVGQSHRMEDGRQSGEPVKLIWDIPTRTRDVIVPFEFKDLKLP